ncbi:hypothetical protein EMIHUDRAFT_434925 [Emiliania huxleyi CCMP1516]|uniref:NAD(P)-binding domain-containing protein n=2 Tax=Emiliania huxleyi TaxID=2903 RepID=A0A0D3JWK1_EMIH1|nr:hypothetical protein EMIHUDRAFT_434925 [Emiliania huxleyi CCMP1516]EOD27886.1 hypothetical protein EMIHUDRAFT_434925 [Emiliania huxleyi CCMP1516]|eukprot:XP_005780315.1 hypothetical protein EMIHUDRAFT_434925 [Emiliania huxleyi CCMP1516]
MLHLCLTAAAWTSELANDAASSPRVLVTGATGRTGSALYLQLKADSRIAEVRALVRNVTKARELLGCKACDESEGVFVGDVTKPETLTAASTGVDTVAIAAAVGGGASQKEMRAVEFDGVEHQVAALAQQNARALPSLRVVLCSSMGTTDPKPAPFKGGSVLFWKLNAEAFLLGSGVGSTIVKPCGLSSGEAGMHGLGVSHNDDLPSPGTFLVARADVARVMREAVIERSAGDVSETFPIESLPRHSAAASCPWHARDSSERHRRCSDLWRPVWHPTVHETVLEACASVSATTPAPRYLPTCPSCCKRRAGRGRRGDVSVSEVRRTSHLTPCVSGSVSEGSLHKCHGEVSRKWPWQETCSG